MKRMAAIVVLVVMLCALLCGCDWWQGQYASVSPHKEANARPEQSVVNAFTYLDLQNALVTFVEAGQKHGIIAATLLNEKYLDDYMLTAIAYAKQECAVGAYAVEDITYEIGKNAGKAAVAVSISYNHRYSEIPNIKIADTVEQAQTVIAQSLKDCSAGVVLKIEEYSDMDITQIVQDYVDTHPDICMEMPQVSAATYPQSGNQRVVEIAYTYQTSRESLRNMQAFVEPVFQASDLNISGLEQESIKFTMIYAFLMERYDYTIKTSITPSYSLLRHGVGDCKAFAVVFAAMCRRGGLECTVVSGTRDGEPWAWNLICEDGVYYHVDLLRSGGGEKLQRLSDADMQGYVWDYSSYPYSMQRRLG